MDVITRKRDDYLTVVRLEHEPIPLRDVTLATISLARDVSMEHDEPVRRSDYVYLALVIVALVLIVAIAAALMWGWTPWWLR